MAAKTKSKKSPKLDTIAELGGEDMYDRVSVTRYSDGTTDSYVLLSIDNGHGSQSVSLARAAVALAIAARTDTEVAEILKTAGFNLD